MVLGANTPSKAKTGLQFLGIVLGITALTMMEYNIGAAYIPTMIWSANGTMFLALLIGIVGTVVFVRTHSSILRSGE